MSNYMFVHFHIKISSTSKILSFFSGEFLWGILALHQLAITLFIGVGETWVFHQNIHVSPPLKSQKDEKSWTKY